MRPGAALADFPAKLSEPLTLVGPHSIADGIHMTKEWSGRQNLHGGTRMAMGEHQYQWFQGRMYNGLLVAMYALEDVNPGDGGFICVRFHYLGCSHRTV